MTQPPEFIRSLIARAAEPYRQAGKYAWHFARGKLGGDPAFAGLLQEGLLSGRNRVLDIGCGRGLLTAWLLAADAEASGRRPAQWPAAPRPTHVRGIELMQHDVDRATTALQADVDAGRASFVAADMCRADFGEGNDAVVILDVLHYVPIEAQDDVLRRVRASLVPGGVLLLRVGDAAAGLPFRISNWVDFVVTTLRGHRLGRLYCRPLAEWESKLASLGFRVDARPMSRGTPFANVLLVARV
ncbi:class I SAM-dependent methyltransferase [Ramlibacter terrae]|uniref:Class I SAM-dependent methyltransferase n=1 Tax=Ramlibacter terrae TaxID=2732511 RepID=A0ABX6P271_9BURK|nr:class I SAM-dependent methyltransferase [Ramlibacter terrae]